MSIPTIPVAVVSYNTPDLIARLLLSFRRHYANPITLIDGSDGERKVQTRAIAQAFADVDFVGFDYNIHHGPGIAWSIQNIDRTGPILFLDSDVEILRAGFVESLVEHLEPNLYGVGDVQYVDEGGVNVASDDPRAIAYLHPACMLCNPDVMRGWPLPIRHGAPMIAPMKAIHAAGSAAILRPVAWVHNDFHKAGKIFINHEWRGTVIRTGGYNLTS